MGILGEVINHVIESCGFFPEYITVISYYFCFVHNKSWCLFYSILFGKTIKKVATWYPEPDLWLETALRF